MKRFLLWGTALAVAWSTGSCRHRTEGGGKAPVKHGKKSVDWSTLTLKSRTLSHETTLSGEKGESLSIKYMISLAEEMKLDKSGSEMNLKQFMTHKRELGPIVRVEVVARSPDGPPPKTIQEAMKFVRLEGREIKRKEKVGSILLVSSQSHEEIQIEAWLPFKEMALHCTSRIFSRGLPNQDALRAWLEQICLSMALK